jgi:hypothetical protein
MRPGRVITRRPPPYLLRSTNTPPAAGDLALPAGVKGTPWIGFLRSDLASHKPYQDLDFRQWNEGAERALIQM